MDESCVNRDRLLNSLTYRRRSQHLLVELLYRLLGGVRLQINIDSDVRIASVSFTQTEKNRKINMPLQLDAQLLNLDALERSLGSVSDRKATAERSEQLLHRIWG